LVANTAFAEYLKQFSVEPPPSALAMTLPAFAAERRRRSTPPAARLQLSSDMSCPQGAQHSGANTPAAVAAVGRWDRRTDGRTLDRYIDPAPRALGQRR